MTQLRKNTKTTKQNTLILDESLIYATGLKKYISEISCFNQSSIDVCCEMCLKSIGKITDYTYIFIDINFYIKYKNAITASNLNEKHTIFLTYVSLINRDIIDLYSYEVAGFIPKSISFSDLDQLCKQVILNKKYIDFDSLLAQLQIEQKFNLKMKFKWYKNAQDDLIPIKRYSLINKRAL